MLAAKLNPGDTVAIVSPSQHVHNRWDAYIQAKENFSKIFNLKIIEAPHATDKFFYTSSTWENRLDDIHKMFADPTVNAVLFSVGGHTAIDLVDRLDYSLIQKNPKIFAGISNATILLNAVFAQTGLITFHGLEFTHFGPFEVPYNIKSIQDTWFSTSIPQINPNSNWKTLKGVPSRYKGWRSIRDGEATGTLIGGNVGAIWQLLHTPYFSPIKNSILVVEAYLYPKKKLHEFFSYLRVHQVLDQINGLIIGHCLGSDDPEVAGNDRDIADIILEISSDHTFPIIEIGEIGHQVENFQLPIGATASFNTNDLSLKLKEPVVTD